MSQPNLYFNDNDPFIGRWLAALYPDATIDARSIVDVHPDDVVGYRRVHWFAGISGWEVALDLAGWPADRPIWTASLPCQPWSAAGSAQGMGDERHLWPTFRSLVAQLRPATLAGEQVASKDGRAWLAGVRADLEALGYAVGAADLCAASVGAPHIRQRLYWVADADGRYPSPEGLSRSGQHGQQSQDGGAPDRLEHATSNGRQQRRAEPSGWGAATRCEPSGLGGAEQYRSQEPRPSQSVERAGRADHWADAILIPCADGKYRRVPAEPEFQPLAHGLSRGRVGTLRGAGNAIVPQVAALFLRAFMDAEGCQHE